MRSSKIRPTLLPERERRETATPPPTANPIPNAGERVGKKQLSMQSDIQITNRNDTCFVDIEGVIGVPEEWQFDQPSSRVATYENSGTASTGCAKSTLRKSSSISARRAAT